MELCEEFVATTLVQEVTSGFESRTIWLRAFRERFFLAPSFSP